MTSLDLDAAQIIANLRRPTADALALPAVTYTDAEIQAAEHARLFEAGWVSVAAAQQLPNPGDVHPVVVAGRPLLLVRDRDNAIRVFHNVCRHRGLELVTRAAHVQGGVITCPYHCWGYGLDGRLKATPYFDGTPKPVPDETVRSELGLLPVRSAVWFDTVFVNLSGKAAPFDEFIRPLAQRWQGFELSELRLADATEFSVAANWKFVVENSLDQYHLPWVHAQLGGPTELYDSQPTDLSEDLFGYIMPSFDAARAETGPTLPLFASLPKQFEYALDLIVIFPNTNILLTPSWAQVMIILPDGPARSRQILAAYLVGDTLFTEENAEARREFVRYLHEVNIQDLEILARLQSGRSGSAADAGRFAPRWDDLAHRLAKRVAVAYG